MPLWAHSARPKQGIPTQRYGEHVRAVEMRARESAEAAARFWSGDRQLFCDIVRHAARWHDLGKLDIENQTVLGGIEGKPLPVEHEYAGIRYLRERNQREAATLVYAHHGGLPNLVKEFSDRPLFETASDPKARERAGRFFASYLEGHRRELGDEETGVRNGSWRASLNSWSGLTWRIALSCLVDADHSDTAQHYGKEIELTPAAPKWGARRESLNLYVSRLGQGEDKDSSRNVLRRRIFEASCARTPVEKLYACDSGVGTGKTTSVMAHLLRVAEERRLRHILVVLPYTNIINQSVRIYRAALVLGEECADEVVAAHHHQMDFERAELRQLATLWSCPVTVTTAVQFFETLAACRTGKLRKLHALPGSAIFIDEAHAALPGWLWPQTWLWIKELTEHWGCHCVLASGSLVKFWEHEEFAIPKMKMPDLLPESIQQDMRAAERERVNYMELVDPLSIEKLDLFLQDQPGPRLVIVNTVRSAAEIANFLRRAGRDVMHLSTALAPMHREAIIHRIEARLRNAGDRDWSLIATSCVEAGVDLSFRSAFREMASTSSMVQIGGRVNRHGREGDARVWVGTFDDARTTRNPSMKIPAGVLRDLFAAQLVRKMDASQLCTEALTRELNEASRDLTEIKSAELRRDFPLVAEKYRVIEDETVTVLVDPIRRRFEAGEQMRSIEIERGSVRIRKKVLGRAGARPLAGSPELYAWTLDYDPEFLGYMSGVLQTNAAFAGEFLEV